MGLLALPSVGQAQVDLGLDAGLGHFRLGGESTTSFYIPVGDVRIGFPVGSSASIESRVSLRIFNGDDETATTIFLAPGVNFPVGPNGMYLRAELAWSYVGGGGDTGNRFGFGGALGHKRPIGDGPVSLRFEAGALQWLENSDFYAGTSIFALVGFSVTVE
jgi:hypothetical protein